MWGAEKVICYLPVYSEPVSCRPVELPSICLSWRTTILRYIVKDNIEYIHKEYIPAKDIPLTTILHTCFDKTPHIPRCTAADTPWNRWSEKHSCLVESYWKMVLTLFDIRHWNIHIWVRFLRTEKMVKMWHFHIFLKLNCDQTVLDELGPKRKHF